MLSRRTDNKAKLLMFRFVRNRQSCPGECKVMKVLMRRMRKTILYRFRTRRMTRVRVMAHTEPGQDSKSGSGQHLLGGDHKWRTLPTMRSHPDGKKSWSGLASLASLTSVRSFQIHFTGYSNRVGQNCLRWSNKGASFEAYRLPLLKFCALGYRYLPPTCKLRGL